MLAGLLVWPMSEAGAVLRCLREFVAETPDEVGIMANLRLTPALPLFPEQLHGKPIVALIVCYTGPIDEGEKVLRPLREFHAPVLDTVGAKSYLAHQQHSTRPTRTAATTTGNLGGCRHSATQRSK